MARFRPMGDFPPVEEQLELLRRGLHDELPAEGLRVKLEASAATGRPLRVKLGVDPTASRVHLGWAVVLRKLRQFQDCGHTAVLILGTFTAQVGDPSGKSQTRKRLSAEQVEKYADQCIGVLRQILLPERLEIRPNHEWLGSMDMAAVLGLATHATVAQMLERDDFAKRFASQKPISLIEFLYPLLQAKDSVVVGADVELGGTDQTFNNLMGRHLQHAVGEEPQVVCTVPLLVGTDGTEKMSQSLGNGIFIDDPPNEMFGRLMSIPDPLIVDYARLAAWRPTAEVDALAAGLAGGTVHPNAAKREMAGQVVDLYHGLGAGKEAEASFDRQFKEHQIPEDVPAFALAVASTGIVELVASAFGVSKGEARRLIGQGGVRLDGERVDDADAVWEAARLDGRVLQAGKRRFVRIETVV